MNDYFTSVIKKVTGATALQQTEIIQKLWNDYGQIVRFQLSNAQHASVVVKHVQLNEQNNHPRGWHSTISHQRKLKSYQVETHWYQKYSHRCNKHCRIPKCYGVDEHNNEVLIVLEDLDASGYPVRKTTVSWEDIQHCIHWLAHFHATFMGMEPDGLWQTGTYWHLATRPDELEALDDSSLKAAASEIDLQLNQSPFQTFVHGDAKLANFCFSPDGKSVSAVDFQYVGGGCGMKDLAYFIGSCLDGDECATMESKILQVYFSSLKEGLRQHQKDIDTNALEENWRMLYPVAWADFHRFMKGWSPNHWKINHYSDRVTKQVVNDLQE